MTSAFSYDRIPVRNSGIGTNSRNSVPELDACACSGVRESYDDHAIPESGGIPGIDVTRNRTEL